ncbi:hypothetical protein [Geopsychrobacter electrodiphilus]|nr:hypothetical protein [Geopsychrobacter electrodiphilus]
MQQIDWSHFNAVELRAGTIVEVEVFPGARVPAHKIRPSSWPYRSVP